MLVYLHSDYGYTHHSKIVLGFKAEASGNFAVGSEARVPSSIQDGLFLRC